jgi:hypothetical protein
MSNNYVLVNPHIQGDFNTTAKKKNSVEAARYFYKNLSEHFNNAVPKFYFTIQKGGSGKGKYYHFKVKETRKNDNVTFSIEPYQIQGGDDISKFTNKLTSFKNKFAQNGGKKSKKSKKDSSESDSESSDDYKRINSYVPVINQPIYYWWYDPSIYRLDTYYIPTFYSYITPVIEISIF